MGRKKRTFTGDFKLKVASEALAGEKTIQAIAAENNICWRYDVFKVA